MGTLRKGTGDPIVKPGGIKPRKPAYPKHKTAAPKTSPRPKPRDYFTGPSTTGTSILKTKPAKPAKPSYKKRAKPIQMRPVKPHRMTK